MIALTRSSARHFRAAARKLFGSRSRGPAPPVFLEIRSGRLTLSVHSPEALLAHTTETTAAEMAFSFLMAVLEAVEGSDESRVELQLGGNLRGSAQWTDAGQALRHPFAAKRSTPAELLPEEPKVWKAQPAHLLDALHESGRIATSVAESKRYTFDRLQLAGRRGEIRSTDGRVLLIQRGFEFPFPEDLLIPAVPIFNSREWKAQPELALGRTPTHLVVRAGPWRAFLPIDAESKYPDFDSVIPKRSPSVGRFDEVDLDELSGLLPKWPGADDESRAVTLEFDRVVIARSKDEKSGRVEEYRLNRSPTTGPPIRFALDRRDLLKAFALGCRTLRAAPNKPLLFESPRATFVTVQFEPISLTAPAKNRVDDSKTLATIPTEVSTPMKPPTPNAPTVARISPPESEQPEALAEAEALRNALADATTRANRLVQLLKVQKKAKKALASVWAGLRQLQLGSEGRP